MPPSQPASFPILPTLGLGILSWKGYQSVESTLVSYQDSGFLDIFSEKLLFLPETEQQGIDLAHKFNIPHKGSEKNLGILGGFKAMAEAMTSKYVILAENDFKLTPNISDYATPLARALEHLESGKSQLWRFRHLQHPGAPLAIDKVMKFWPATDASIQEKAIAALRRLCRPQKAHRLKGMTSYIYPDLDQRFPDVVQKTADGDFLLRSDITNWTNNVFMINREFFLNEVIKTAEENIGGRLINGFPTIETELNRCGWWQKQKFTVGVSNPGIFTHGRLNDRGY